MIDMVPPSMSKDFEDAWATFEKETKDAHKGHLNWLSMKKVATSNLIYFQYEEWDTAHEHMDHMEADHFKDWIDFIDGHGIRFEVEPLINESEDIEDQKQKSVERKRKSDEDKNTHVLAFYDVPPMLHDDFIDAWTDTAKDTIKEDGNLIYTLRHSRHSNTRFYVYGTWESFNAYQDHHESKHLGRLHEFAAKEDIIWFLAPLEVVGEGMRY